MIQKQIGIFLIVGSLTVAIDYGFYIMLISLLDIDLAKAAGFIIGTVFAYLANRLWTFNRPAVKADSILRFILLYALTLGINVFVNSVLNRIFIDLEYIRQFAFLAATGISATLNFIGMKFFVFKPATDQ